MMDRKETKALLKKANELKDRIGEVMNEADIEIGLALTVLVAMTVDTALKAAEIPPHELIRMLAQSVCKAQEVIEEELDEEGEDDGETISRTTH
jgi:predicted nucleotidyltransferase